MHQAGRLAGKVALITGAGRGIGRAISLAFAAEGARLALAARTSGELEETAVQAGALGAECLVVPADVTRREDIDALARKTLGHYQTIDILVNCAGIGGPVGLLQDNDVDSWIETIQVNLVGTYLGCRAVIPTMIAQGRGKIINLSGAGATNAWDNMSAYCASKAAVVRLTEVLSLELAPHNVQVNALGPGSIHTRMWEEMRDDAAAANATHIYEQGKIVTSGGGAPIEKAADLAVFLAGETSGTLSGRMISAVADDFANMPSRIPEIMGSEAYTLRRVGLGPQAA